MGNQFRVCWLHHSHVYHRADYRYRRGPDTYAPCGVVVASALFRCREGSERAAKALGLRRCRRCFREAPIFDAAAV